MGVERLSPPQEKETTQGGNGSDTEGLLGTDSGISLCPGFNVHILVQSSQQPIDYAHFMEEETEAQRS